MLDGILSEDADRRLCASTSLLLVSRQNGKNVILEVLELYACFVLEWREIIHTAHLQDSSATHQARLKQVVEADSELSRITKFIVANGKEAMIRTDTEAAVRFMTRSKKIGRSKSPRLIVFDEALFVEDLHLSALVPSLSAQSMRDDAPLMVYTSSAPLAESYVLQRLITAFVDGGRDGFFADWGAPPGTDIYDREEWRLSNPGFNIRISEEWIENEELPPKGILSPEAFAIERLGVVFAPEHFRVIPAALWDAACSPSVQPEGRIVFAVEVSPDRDFTAICAAGTSGGVELVDYRPGVGWVDQRLTELKAKHAGRVVFEARSPAAALGLKGDELSTSDAVKAAGGFFDGIVEGRIRVRSDGRMDAALAGAVKQTVGEAWRFGRKAGADCSPLIAATLAVFAAGESKGRPVFAY